MGECQECERLKNDLAKVRAENNRLKDELRKQTDRILLIKRVLDEAEQAGAWMEK